MPEEMYRARRVRPRVGPTPNVEQRLSALEAHVAALTRALEEIATDVSEISQRATTWGGESDEPAQAPAE